MPTTAEHVVLFYDQDEECLGKVTEFVREGRSRGERVFLLTPPGRWREVRDRLIGSGEDVDAAIRSRDIVVLDAGELAQRIVIDGHLDGDIVRDLLPKAEDAGDRPFRVFGDLVSLLASRGLVDAAVEFEALGHELAHEIGALVLCAYDLRQLSDGPASTSRIRHAHDRALDMPPAARSGPVVLVADDFADTRDLYRDVLELEGFTVVTAADGVEALEVARRDRPAILVLDIRMPRLSGLDAMRALKADQTCAGAPIVALTAHAFPADRAMLLDEGFDAVLAKPCLPDQLVEIIASLLPPSAAQ
jgi:CheY-like chemotaxis protein